MTYRVHAILCHESKPDLIFDAEMAFETEQQAIDWISDDCESGGFFDFESECSTPEFDGYWLDEGIIVDMNEQVNQ